MNLILIRHGDSFQESGDPSLTGVGIAKSKLLANRLSKLPVSKVYVSSLNRAFQTFEEYHKLMSNIPFEKTEDLKEIYRVLVGGAKKEGTSSTREPEDKKRIDSFIKKISSMNNEETIAIISHGNALRYILAKFLDSEPRKIGTHIDLAPASISLISIEKDEVIVKFINNIEHLTNENSSDSYFFKKKSENYVA